MLFDLARQDFTSSLPTYLVPKLVSTPCLSLLPYILHHLTYMYLLSLRRVLTTLTRTRPEAPLVSLFCRRFYRTLFIARGRVFPCYFTLHVIHACRSVSLSSTIHSHSLRIHRLPYVNYRLPDTIFRDLRALIDVDHAATESGCKGPVSLELFQPATIQLQVGRGVVLLPPLNSCLWCLSSDPPSPLL